jgi:hypothetical protein
MNRGNLNLCVENRLLVRLESIVVKMFSSTFLKLQEFHRCSVLYNKRNGYSL